MNTEKRRVTLDKIVKGDDTQYWVRVNGLHITGGCIKDKEEAEKFFDLVCSDKYNKYSIELLKEKLL